MALPTYASPLEKIWHYAYLAICAAIFFFLIAVSYTHLDVYKRQDHDTEMAERFNAWLAAN